jgi:hypothetical protein
LILFFLLSVAAFRPSIDRHDCTPSFPEIEPATSHTHRSAAALRRLSGCAYLGSDGG